VTEDSPQPDDRPWERPPAQRLDFEPHRGRLLLVLATLSVVCGWLSCCFVVPSLLGLPLALGACLVARHDLNRMRVGLVDRGGYGQTEAALSRSIDGLCLNILIFGQCIYILIHILWLL